MSAEEGSRAETTETRDRRERRPTWIGALVAGGSRLWRRSRPFPPRVVTADVRQAEHAECGLAALAIAMGGHGVHVRLETLRRLAGSTVHGTRIAALRDLARSFGLPASVHRAETGWLGVLGFPVVCHMRFIHFVAVEAVDDQVVRINDPIGGPALLPRADFDRDYTGLALRLKPPNGPVSAPVEGPHLPGDGEAFRTASAVVRRLRPAVPVLAAGLAAALLSGTALGLSAVLAGRAFDLSMSDAAAAPPAALAAIGSGLLGLLSGFAAEAVATGALGRLARSMRERMLREMEALPSEVLLLRNTEQFSDKLKAPDALAEPAQIRAVAALPALCGMLAVLATISPAAFAVSTFFVASDLALIVLNARRRGSYVVRFGKGSWPATSFGEDVFRYPDGWMLGDGDEVLFNRIAGLHALSAAPALRAGYSFAGLASALKASRVLRLVLVLTVVGFAVMESRLSMGEGVAAVALTALLTIAVSPIVALVSLARLRSGLIALEDFDAIVAAAAHVQREASPARRGGLTIEIASAGWRPATRLPPVLEGVCGRVGAGSGLAIVGPSGSGGTTLCRMIAGLLHPSSGQVLGDGVPVADLPPGRIILVERGGAILPASIRSNLRLGGEFDDATLESALDTLGLTATLRLRGGLDLVLTGEGRELSGGERARLLIARALVRSPGVLVVDGLFDTVEVDRAAAVIGAIRASGTTLVLTSAREETIALMDGVLRLGSAGRRAA